MYLHFPWCRKLCPYCDFAVEVAKAGDVPPHDAYLAAILAELELRAPAFAGELVSIYFGGGTPSLWRVDCIAAAIAAIRARFGDAHDAVDEQREAIGGGDHAGFAGGAGGNAPRGIEVTLEANPTDCTHANLAAWRAAGVNRVSIGVQSLAADELLVLGRDHRHGDGTAALTAALAAGLTVSADFILGAPTPGQPSTSSPAWIAPVVATAVEHLSVYELTIEDRTAFGKRVRAGTLVPRDDDTLTALYTATHAALATAGFEHYEISSYARAGKRAVHNALYWRGAPYLGLGVGAASLAIALDGSGVGTRATNPRRAAAYLAAPGVAAETTIVPADEMAIDRAWLGMRTSDGVAEVDLPAEVTRWLVGDGLAERRDGFICPTLRGFLFADRIAARIVQSTA